MRLDDWLRQRNVQKSAFAESVGIHPTTFSRILQGQALTRSNVEAIWRGTAGEVTPNDLFGLGPEEAETAGKAAEAPPFLSEFRPVRPGFDGRTPVIEAAVRLAHRALTEGVDPHDAAGVVVHAVRVPRRPSTGNAKAARDFAAAPAAAVVEGGLR